MVDAAPITPPTAPAGSNLTTSITNSSGSGTTTQAQNQQGNQALNVQQAPQFLPQQQQMQNQAANLMSMIMTGQTPHYFGLPQSVYDSAFYNFNKYQEPQLAAQYGAGSPMINNSMQELQLQLAGLGGQYALPNALNAFRDAGSFAFNPIAMNQQQQQTNASTANTNTNANSSSNSMTNNINTGGLLGSLVNGLSGGFQLF